VLNGGSSYADGYRLIPGYSPEQIRDGCLTMMANLNRERIMAIKDPGMEAENWRMCDEFRRQDKLTIHLFDLWRGGANVTQTQAALRHIPSLPRPTDRAALQKDGRLILA
jgi:hypothetical protein